jgi:AcrR family transcriptional regulator
VTAATAIPVQARRRTQAERSEVTQLRLLEATVACLAELGYARMTTVAVGRRAGLSRGAHLHHFGTKLELVTRAVQHLHERQIAEFRRAMASLPPGRDPHEAAVDVIWEITASVSFAAWLELVVASRTDPDLRATMSSLDRLFMESAGRIFSELFPDEAGTEFAALAPLFTFVVLDGLALRRILGSDEREAGAVLDTLKAIAQLMKPTRSAEEGP